MDRQSVGGGETGKERVKKGEDERKRHKTRGRKEEKVSWQT